MKKALIRNIQECKKNDRGMIILNEEAETISMNIVSIKTGESTELGFHDDEEEVYVVLGGKAKIRLGDIESEVGPGTAIYIPRNTYHQSTCISKENYEFVCVANWPDKVSQE